MKGFDYRIRSRKDVLPGTIAELLDGDYANIRLTDGRTLRYVRVPAGSAVGDRVMVERSGGRWMVR